MAKRYERKLAILAKLESAYGTDSAPTGAANAVQIRDVTMTPIEATEVSRDLLLPYLGQQGVELVGLYNRIEFSVELAGSGVAGTAPAYGPILRACALAETITAGTSVEYETVSEAFESASLYYNSDGVRHVMLGCRGNMSLSLSPSQIPLMRFTLTGLLGTIADAALPAVDLTKFKRPPVVSKANTTMVLHGWSAVAESVSLDLGNQVESRVLIGEETIEMVDRNMTGSAVVEARSIATVDWFDRALKRTRAPLVIVHGKTAGNIVQIDAPAVEIGRPTEGATQKIRNYTLPLMPCPVAGDDEFKLTVK